MKGVQVFALEPQEHVAGLFRGGKYPAAQRSSCSVLFHASKYKKFQIRFFSSKVFVDFH